MNSARPFVVLVFFMFFIILLAGGSVGSTDLTPDTPPAILNTGDSQFVMGVNTGQCGSVYEVRSGDTLSRIARNCGITLSDLLSVNPTITNPNLIHPGQKINLFYRSEPTVPAEAVPEPTPTNPPAEESAPTAANPPAADPPAAPVNGLRPGGTVEVVLEGFPADSKVFVGIGPVDGNLIGTAEAQTDAAGRIDMKMPIPTEAKAGEIWVVTVFTVDEPKVQMTTDPFTIEE